MGPGLVRLVEAAWAVSLGDRVAIGIRRIFGVSSPTTIAACASTENRGKSRENAVPGPDFGARQR